MSRDGAGDLSEEENDLLWADEAERRFAEYKAGNLESIPADELFFRLRASPDASAIRSD